MVEADKWLYEMRHQDEYGDGIDADGITVDEWFTFWHTELIKDLAAKTRRNYAERYSKNINPIIGRMRLKNMKPIHCTKILNSMDDEYAGSTIYQTYTTLGTMFKSAKLNGKIKIHTLDGVKCSKSTKAVDNLEVFTVEEQRRLLHTARISHNYISTPFCWKQGEMITLTRDDVDWERRTLTIHKTMEFRYKQQFWVAEPPKTMSSYRTSRAYDSLKEAYATKDTHKRPPNWTPFWHTQTSGKSGKIRSRKRASI